MKNMILGLLVVGSVGCSHMKEAPKTVEFTYAAELLQKVQLGVARAPASLELETEEQPSPRRVYFSALYQQYLTLGQHLNKKSDIQFCPAFHHDKIQTDSTIVPKVTIYPASQIDEEGKEFFPELAFNKKFSLRDYHGVIKGELETLCEEGVSDNYFKFDNLVTHYAGKKSFHTKPEAMKSVLKIPVFANFYLVKMLEIPGLHLESPEEKRFIKLTQTYWFEKYVTEASRMRNNFIKNKMVQR
ncbi:hypothetical protein [Peredibacter starrii]|uniref:Lipoprotein n=1 Tax=Peredibacter starrii TaxID=28202 RepID=A0AAX4HKN1_9BACT|nr:hypothetical protein [Peredibacter starrii]WPU63781.1 hypothetical protein SOO65_13890 [Peredibacter starrii]